VGLASSSCSGARWHALMRLRATTHLTPSLAAVTACMEVAGLASLLGSAGMPAAEAVAGGACMQHAKQELVKQAVHVPSLLVAWPDAALLG
jgi:hypothetical protein